MADVKVWVPDKKLVWKVASVLGDVGKDIVLTSHDGGSTRIPVPKSSTHPVDPSHLQTPVDVCDIKNIHDAPLLDILRKRFQQDIFYTNASDFLISFNPYKSIPPKIPLEYIHLSDDHDADETPPHAFTLANAALSSLIRNSEPDFRENHHDPQSLRINQSVIVSGESGSGKTEASKLIIDFLIAANIAMNARDGDDSVGVDFGLIGKQIRNILLNSTIVYESIGNAKTIRNDNSSRFGKHFKLEYTDDNTLLAAYTETFLLEQARLVSVGQGERNYHVFYRLVQGLPKIQPKLATSLRLSLVENFNILTEGGCTLISTEREDEERFHALVDALRVLEVSEAELERLWSLLAAILHIGNLAFSAGESDSEPAAVEAPPEGLAVEQLADILGISKEDFIRCLTMQKVSTSSRASVNVKYLSHQTARNNAFSMIKWLYRSMFSWIVRKINSVFGAVAISGGGQVVKYIGILDIFGFESLAKNSFEQLCINYTNERLQQQFTEHVFVAQEQEYLRQGIQWAPISFTSNADVINLISQKPTGLFVILEEHSILNLARKPEDSKLLEAFDETHDKVHPCYVSATAGLDFAIKHYAGEVTYCIDGFLAKNNDALQEELVVVMSSSTNTFLLSAMMVGSLTPSDVGYIPVGQELNVVAVAPGEEAVAAGAAGGVQVAKSSQFSLESERAERVKNARKSNSGVATVSLRFRNQLNMLMETLDRTQLHYIKCIKPNNTKTPNDFDSQVVMHQLRCSGILEVVRMKQQGYPIRMPFEKFYEEFEILGHMQGWAPAADCSEEEAKEYSAAIAAKVLPPPPAYQLAHRAVFLTETCVQTLADAVQALLHRCAAKIGAQFRAFSASLKFQSLLWAAIKIQSLHRMQMLRKPYVVQRAEAERVKREQEAAMLLTKQEEERRRQQEEQQRIKQEAEDRAKAAEEERERARLEAEARERDLKEKRERRRLEVEAKAKAQAAVEEARLQEERLAQLERDEAAKAIQAVVRGRLALKQKASSSSHNGGDGDGEEDQQQQQEEEDEETRRDFAAMAIQALVRGMLARQRVMVLLDEEYQKGIAAAKEKKQQEQQEQQQQQAALAMQAVVRGHLARNKVEAMLDAEFAAEADSDMAKAEEEEEEEEAEVDPEQQEQLAGVKSKRRVSFKEVPEFGPSVEEPVSPSTSDRSPGHSPSHSPGQSPGHSPGHSPDTSPPSRQDSSPTASQVQAQAAALAQALAQANAEEDEAAAVKVQAIVRGHLARLQLGRILDERDAALQDEEFSARTHLKGVGGSYDERDGDDVYGLDQGRPSPEGGFDMYDVYGKEGGSDDGIPGFPSLQSPAAAAEAMSSPQSPVAAASSQLRAAMQAQQSPPAEQPQQQQNQLQQEQQQQLSSHSTSNGFSSPRNIVSSASSSSSSSRAVWMPPSTGYSVAAEGAAAKIAWVLGRIARFRSFQRHVHKLHTACELGDMETVKLGMQCYAEDLAVLDRTEQQVFSTVFQAAIRGNKLAALQELDPKPSDVKAKDINGCTLFHHATTHRPNLLTVKFLGDVIAMWSHSTATPTRPNSRRITYSPPPEHLQHSSKAPILPAGSGPGGVIKQGWLYKLNKHGVWQRRYFILKASQLSYSKGNVGVARDQFKLGKNVASFARRADLPGCAAVLKVAAGSSSEIKRKPSLLFRAESEDELQEWLKHLGTCATRENFRTGKPITALDYDLLSSVVSQKNVFGDTALHTLARNIGAGDADFKVAAWLVEHGCPINAQNKLGKSAVLVAVENSNDVLAKCLQQLGADVLLRDNTGKSAVDLCRDALKKSLLSQGHLKALCAPHLGPPARGLGLTYLSLHLELLRISKSGRIKGRSLSVGEAEHLYLSVSVYKLHKSSFLSDLLEEVQDVFVSVYSDAEQMWWGRLWYMRTPMELLSAESTVIVLELKSGPPGRKVAAQTLTLGWACYRIQKDQLDTSHASLSFTPGAFDVSALVPSGSPNSNRGSPANSAGFAAYGTPAESIAALEVGVVLARRADPDDPSITALAPRDPVRVGSLLKSAYRRSRGVSSKSSSSPSSSRPSSRSLPPNSSASANTSTIPNGPETVSPAPNGIKSNAYETPLMENPMTALKSPTAGGNVANGAHSPAPGDRSHSPYTPLTEQALQQQQQQQRAAPDRSFFAPSNQLLTPPNVPRRPTMKPRLGGLGADNPTAEELAAEAAELAAEATHGPATTNGTAGSSSGTGVRAVSATGPAGRVLPASTPPMSPLSSPYSVAGSAAGSGSGLGSAAKPMCQVVAREFRRGVDKPTLYRLTVPPGSGRGTVIHHLGPGKNLSIQLPDGVAPGDKIIIVAPEPTEMARRSS